MARTVIVTKRGAHLPSSLSTKRRAVTPYKNQGTTKNYRWTSQLGALFAVMNYALVHGGSLPVLVEPVSIPTGVNLITATTTTTSTECSSTDTPTCSDTGTFVHSDDIRTASMDMRMRTRMKAIQYQVHLTPDTDTKTISSRALRPRKFHRNYKV